MINKLTLIPALAALAMATPALAADPRVNVANNSGMTVERVYMSETGTDDWGPDLLGRNVLRPGYRINWMHPAYASDYNCYYDLKVQFVNGRTMQIRRFNACAASTVTVNSWSMNIA